MLELFHAVNVFQLVDAIIESMTLCTQTLYGCAYTRSIYLAVTFTDEIGEREKMRETEWG